MNIIKLVLWVVWAVLISTAFACVFTGSILGTYFLAILSYTVYLRIGDVDKRKGVMY